MFLIDPILDFVEGLWTELFSTVASAFTLIIILNDARPPALIVILLSMICIGSMVVSAYQWWTETHVKPILFLVAFLATVVMSLASVYIALHYVSDKANFTGIITDRRWHYEWDVEQWSAFNSSCWSVNCQPRTSYDVSKRWEDTGNDRYVGEDCKTEWYTDSDGDRRSRQKCTSVYEDIYDWHVYYTDNGWQRVRTEVSSDKNTEPHWPELKLQRQYDTLKCRASLPTTGKYAEMLGCQRAAGQRSYYYFTFRIQHPIDLTKECDLPNSLDAYHFAKIEKTIEGEYWAHQFIADCLSVKIK